MHEIETTQPTILFFILQAMIVIMIAWLFIFFLLRSRRKRTETLRLFKKLAKHCSLDQRLNSLVNDYSENSLAYMQSLVSPKENGKESEMLLRSLNTLNEYIEKSGSYKHFISPKLDEKGKLYKSTLLMKQIYTDNYKE